MIVFQSPPRLDTSVGSQYFGSVGPTGIVHAQEPNCKSVNIALRRATNLRRDPRPQTTRTIITATTAMRNPKKLIVLLPPVLEVLVGVSAGDEAVGDGLVEDMVSSVRISRGAA